MSHKNQLNHPNFERLNTLVDLVAKEYRNIKEAEKSSVIFRMLSKSQTGSEVKIEKLNEALRFAVRDEDFARVYATRWEISVAIGSYLNAIRNIDLALLHHHLDAKKLLESKEFCQKKLAEIENRTNGIQQVHQNTNKVVPSASSNRVTLKLSREAHPQIPWIIKCLELKEDAEDGKYIITTEDLKVGEIVAIDKSCHVSGLEENLGSKCTNCLKHALLTLIPCPGCTSVMFCSPECLEAATYHRYECKRIHESFKTCNSHLTVLRSLFTAIAAYNGNIGEMCEYFEANEGKTIFDFDFSDPSHPDFMKNYVLASYFMKVSDKWFYTIDKQRNWGVEFKPILKAIPQTNKAMLKCSKCRSFMLKFLVKSALNVVVGKTIGGAKEWGGTFPMLSLFHHSCAPNLQMVCSDAGVNTYVVIFPIKANEAVTTCHGSPFAETSFTERQRSIEKNVGVVCSCSACKFKYPTMTRMNTANKKLLKQVEKQLNREDMDSDERSKWIDEYGVYLKKNMATYPTKEMVLMQRFIVKTYSEVISKVVLSEENEMIYGKNNQRKKEGFKTTFGVIMEKEVE